jgi:hypothetical protein
MAGSTSTVDLGGRPSALARTAKPPRCLPARSDLSSGLLWAAALVIALPIVVAAARGIAREWLPAGDNGLLYIRTRDVLSGEIPLLGSWSFASTRAGFDFNHPGPLLYDLLAVPTWLLGPNGMAVGAAVLNAAAAVGTVLVAARRGGRLTAAVAAAVTATLAWTMGSELLFDPWQPNLLMICFLLYLVLVWSVSSGDLRTLPLLAAVGSLILQTNLSHALLVPSLGAWALVGLLLHLRGRRLGEPDAWPRVRRGALQVGAVTAAVLAACWFQPVLEQLFGEGEGNLSLLVRSRGAATSTRGLAEGLRLLGGVTALPPWWLRPSLGTVYWSLPSVAAATGALVTLAAALGLSAWDARRRGDRILSCAVTTAAVALLAGLVTATRSPVGGATYHTRFLWPVSAFITLVVVLALLLRLPETTWRAAAVRLLAAAAIVVSLVNLLPATPYGTDAPAWTLPVIRHVNSQLGELEDRGTLFYDWHNDRFVQHYGSAILAELTRRGVDVVFDKEMLVRMLGEGRRFTGDNADAVLTIRVGDAAYDLPPGGRRVALHEGLPPHERRELATLKDLIADHIDDGHVRLNDEGEAALRRLAVLLGDDPPDPDGFDGERLLESGDLLRLLARGYLELDEGWVPRFARYRALQQRSDVATVGVFVRPLA